MSTFTTRGGNMLQLDEHELGECEVRTGHLCVDCANWYNEQADDWALSKDDLGCEGPYA